MKIIYTILAVLCCNLSFTQTNADVGRIVLNSTVIDNDKKVPEEASMQLISKLQQIATNSGLGGNSINPRFVLAVKPNVTTKDIIAGPPQMLSLNLEFVFFIGDAIEPMQFSSLTLNVKGVGTNENKAYINAIQNINPRNKEFGPFITTGKGKIVEYYARRCEAISVKAKVLSDKQEFDAAIYEIMQIPDACGPCYEKSLNEVRSIYQKKVDSEGKKAYLEANKKWSSNSNSTGAKEALAILGNIDPSSSVFKDAIALSRSIQKKISEDEKREWDFKMKAYQDDVELEKERLDAARKIAVAYFKNQPKTIVYNRLIW
jgi:hypothetical protein